MEIFLGLVAALFLSMVLMPLLMKYATSLGLVDIPDERKRHRGPVPRVGGIAIAMGAVTPALIWLVLDTRLIAYVVGAFVIVAFGVLDDRQSLDYRVKFLGQSVASLILIAGDVCIYHIPLFGMDSIPASLAYPLTFVFMLTVTNAFNLLDGLDGLAAGCAILSLGAVVALTLSVNGAEAVVLFAVTTIGAVLGFLRYNTHPAVVFMGDSGSQFLGFSIGAFTILLMEHTQNAMSPAVPLLIFGLPILDTLMVMVLRIRNGRSPFSPDRNHIHHKLLSIGLRHYEAVAIIYAVQALMVSLAFVLRYEADGTVLLAYLGICVTCVVSYIVVRNSGWLVHRVALPDAAEHKPFGQRTALIQRVTISYVEWSVGVYLIAGALLVKGITPDVAVLMLATAGLVATSVVWQGKLSVPVTRVTAYLAAIIVTYYALKSVDQSWIDSMRVSGWLITVAMAVGVAIYLLPRGQFQITTLDLLIVLVTFGVLALPMPTPGRIALGGMLLPVLILLYSCELLLSLHPPRQRPLAMATVISLVTIGLASLFE